MKSGNSTRPSRSPTPIACDLTPLTGTRTPEHEYNALTASNRRPSTRLQQHSPTLFTRNPVVCFLKVDKTTVDIENLLENVNLVCGATAGMYTALGIIQLWFNYFAASSFKALGIHFSKEQERDAAVVGACSPVFLLVYGENHSTLPIFCYPPTTTDH